MNTRFLLLFVFNCWTVSILAQSGFSYQAVLRNDDGNIMPSQPLQLTISVLDGEENPLFREIHEVTTTELGLINVLVGQGQIIDGDFEFIKGIPNLQLKVEAQLEGASEILDFGSSPVGMVPYALYGEDADADPDNELQDLTIDGDTLRLSKSNVGISMRNLQALWERDGESLRYGNVRVFGDSLLIGSEENARSNEFSNEFKVTDLGIFFAGLFGEFKLRSIFDIEKIEFLNSEIGRFRMSPSWNDNLPNIQFNSGESDEWSIGLGQFAGTIHGTEEDPAQPGVVIENSSGDYQAIGPFEVSFGWGDNDIVYQTKVGTGQPFLIDDKILKIINPEEQLEPDNYFQRKLKNFESLLAEYLDNRTVLDLNKFDATTFAAIYGSNFLTYYQYVKDQVSQENFSTTRTITPTSIADEIDLTWLTTYSKLRDDPTLQKREEIKSEENEVVQTEVLDPFGFYITDELFRSPIGGSMNRMIYGPLMVKKQTILDEDVDNAEPVLEETLERTDDNTTHNQSISTPDGEKSHEIVISNSSISEQTSIRNEKKELIKVLSLINDIASRKLILDEKEIETLEYGGSLEEIIGDEKLTSQLTQWLMDNGFEDSDFNNLIAERIGNQLRIFNCDSVSFEITFPNGLSSSEEIQIYLDTYNTGEDISTEAEYRDMKLVEIFTYATDETFSQRSKIDRAVSHFQEINTFNGQFGAGITVASDIEGENETFAGTFATANNNGLTGFLGPLPNFDKTKPWSGLINGQQFTKVNTTSNDGAATTEWFGAAGMRTVFIGKGSNANSGGLFIFDQSDPNAPAASITTTSEGVSQVVAGTYLTNMGKSTSRNNDHIVYGPMMGGEQAVYHRGTAQLKEGASFVSLPGHFLETADLASMTVTVTPLSGDSKGIAVIEKSAQGFKVKELFSGTGTYQFDYMISCRRKNIQHQLYQVIPEVQQNQVNTLEFTILKK